MSSDEISFLSSSGDPRIISVFGFLILIYYGLKIAAQASETFAKMLGGLGRRWQAQRRRAEEEAREERAAKNAVIEDLRSQVDHFVGRVETMDKRLNRLQTDADLRDDYLAYDAEWHAELDRSAAGGGFVPPPHMTFREFVLARRNTTPTPSSEAEASEQ